MNAVLPSYTFSCPGCYRELELVKKREGMLVACPWCGCIFLMPAGLTFNTAIRQANGLVGTGGQPKRADGNSGTGNSPKRGSFYIVPKPVRPRSISVYAVLGIAALAMSVGIELWALKYRPDFVFHRRFWGNDRDLLLLTGVVAPGLFKVVFLGVFIGLIKGWNTARSLFLFLGSLSVILLGGLTAYQFYQISEGMKVDMAAVYYQLGIMLYLLAGMVFLLRKRIRVWFD